MRALIKASSCFALQPCHSHGLPPSHPIRLVHGPSQGARRHRARSRHVSAARRRPSPRVRDRGNLEPPAPLRLAPGAQGWLRRGDRARNTGICPWPRSWRSASTLSRLTGMVDQCLGRLRATGGVATGRSRARSGVLIPLSWISSSLAASASLLPRMIVLPLGGEVAQLAGAGQRRVPTQRNAWLPAIVVLASMPMQDRCRPRDDRNR